MQPSKIVMVDFDGVIADSWCWGWHGEEHLRRAAPDRIARHPHELLDLLG